MSAPCKHIAIRFDVPEDLENLVNLRVAGEQRLARAHFGEDAANRPHVDTCRVLTATKQNLWGAVPQRNNLQRVRQDI